MVRWITRLEEAPGRRDAPLAWIAPHAEASGWPLPPPSPEDLADAAQARRDGGGPRLLRRRLLRALVARGCGLHPQAVRFTRTAQGAPGLAESDLHISAAGCEGWSIVALSPRPVGVDIERVDRRAALDAPDWVLLEAYLKALGRGLAIAPEAVRLQAPADPGQPYRLACDARPAGRGWRHGGCEAEAALVELA